MSGTPLCSGPVSLSSQAEKVGHRLENSLDRVKGRQSMLGEGRILTLNSLMHKFTVEPLASTPPNE